MTISKKYICVILMEHFGMLSENYTRLLVCLLTPSCLTLSGPLDCSLAVSSVHGFFRQESPNLVWVAISLSKLNMQTPKLSLKVCELLCKKALNPIILVLC